VDYGFSFGSKKVNMGPAFLSLDVMCQCLAKAIMKHLHYSKGVHLFVDELHGGGELEFTYNFKKELKITSPSGKGQYDTPKDARTGFQELERKMQDKLEMKQVESDDEDLSREDSSEEIIDETETQFIEEMRREQLRLSILRRNE